MCLLNGFDPIFQLIGNDPKNESFMEFKNIKSAKVFCHANRTGFLSTAL
jgi:hypothetical protein